MDLRPSANRALLEERWIKQGGSALLQGLMARVFRSISTKGPKGPLTSNVFVL